MIVLVLGGLGFLGSSLCNYLNSNGHKVVIVDKNTYAADRRRLNFIPEAIIIRDICAGISDVLTTYKPTLIYNLVAESHVDNSIKSSIVFWQTNVTGTAVAMEQIAKIVPDATVVHFSTDEFYGPFKSGPPFKEHKPANPSSPYAYSKVAQELAVDSCVKNYGLKNVVSIRPNNVYGSRQHVEKLIPTIISRAMRDQPIPIYGDGLQQRPWLYVDDLCEAVYRLGFNRDKWTSSVYNISSNPINITNKTLTEMILTKMGKPFTLLTYVEDRLNHDFKYFTDDSRFRCDFNWKPLVSLEQGLDETIKYYINQR